MEDITKVIVTDEDFDECPFQRDSFINLFMLAEMIEADKREEE